MKTLNKFLSENQLTDLCLLKEFISRGLKGPATIACDDAIKTYVKKIEALGELKKQLEEEV